MIKRIGIALTALCGLFIAVASVGHSEPTTQLAHNHPIAADRNAPVGSANANGLLSMQVRFALRNRAELNKLLAEQQDPASPNYHRWLKPAEFEQRFGPRKADVAAVKKWLKDEGYSIDAEGSRYVRFHGAVSRAERTFSVKLLKFGNGAVYGHSEDPMIPSKFAGVIENVVGLDNMMATRPVLQGRHAALNGPSAPTAKERVAGGFQIAMASRHDSSSVPLARIGGVNAFGPADFRTFYNENPILIQGNTGSGNCIAVVGDSEYIDKAITAFNTQFGLPASNITRVIVDGTNPSYNDDESEALLDLEWSHVAAPGAPQRYYLGNPKVGAVQALVDAISRAASDNTCDVIGVSFAICGASQAFLTGTLDPLFAQATSQGQSVFVAAGDQGAAGLVFDSLHNTCATGSSQNVNEMSASTNVTSVGGTAFNPVFDANGNDVGSVVERAWNDPNDGLPFAGAGGGGPSAVFLKPSYQQGVTPADGKRDTPDVSLIGSPNFPGAWFANDNGFLNAVFQIEGGTSLSTQAWSGIAKMLDQVAGQRQGNLNPKIYQLAMQNLAGNGFRDVTLGDNDFNNVTGFAADTGYDEATGWGTLDITAFISAAASLPTTPTPTATSTIFVPPTITPTPTLTATPTVTLTPTATATATTSITFAGSSNTTSTTNTVPAGVQNGDLLLAFYSYWSHATVTPPAGWTLLHTMTSTNSGVMAVWYRFANNDAPGSSYNWSFGAATPFEAGGMLAYRGVDPSAFEDGSCLNQGHSTIPVLCSFATANSNDMYLGFFSTENTNLFLPGDLVGRVLNQYVANSHFGVGAGNKPLSFAGTVPADSGSMNNGGWATIAFALKPLGSGPTPTATSTVVSPTPTITATTVPTVAPTPTLTIVATPTMTATTTLTSTPTATPTPGAITLVGSTTTTTSTNALPNGIQNGDLLLAFYSYWSRATATAPAGWTLLHSATSTNSGVETLWYRFANNESPGGSYSWTFSGATPYASGGMLAYRGVAASFEDGFCTNQGRSTAPSLCSFSTTSSSDVYLGFFSTENTNLILPPDLTALVLNQYLAGFRFGVGVGAKSLGAPGTVPADTGAMNSGGWATVAFALRPLASGPTPTVTATPVPTSPGPTPTATATPTSITLVGSTSTTSSKVTVPAGVQNGDLLLAFYSYWSLATATAPSGWTLLHSATSSNSGVETVWYRVAGNDAPGSQYTWTFTGSGPYAAGGVLAYRGVAGAPFEDGFCTNQGRSTAPTLCSFATTSSNDTYVGFFATEATNLVLPGDLSALVVNQYASGLHFGVAAANKALGSAGTVPADIGSMNSGGWASIAFALKKAP